jgi:hypothetical protein
MCKFFELATTRWAWGVQFLRYWTEFAFRDAAAATFGWAAIFGSAFVLGALRYRGFQMNPSQSPQWSEVLFFAFAGAGAAWCIAFVVNFFIVSPIKAYRVMKPFVLSISDAIMSSEFVRNDQMRGYNATLIIKNRSSRYLIDCHVHIVEITGIDAKQFPRFVANFDLPPGEKKHLTIAYWFAREAPYTDDETIGISGPAESGFGGNILRIPVSDYIFKIRVWVPDSRSKLVGCRLWIDAAARKLKATYA